MDEIRVLHKLPGLSVGGVEKIIISWQENLNMDNIKFDYLIDSNENIFYEDKVVRLGSKIENLKLDKSKGNKILKLVYKQVKTYKFLKKTNYNIIHIHESPFNTAVTLLIAKIAGVKIRIAHSHTNFYNQKNILGKLLLNLTTRLNSILATKGISCSEEAKDFMFNKRSNNQQKFTILNNGIDSKNYKFNLEIRNKIRGELNLNGKFVLGNVSRFVIEKNHLFMIEILFEIKKKYIDTCLILVGEGPEKEEIYNKVRELKLEENIIFLGVKENVNEILQAMDVFLFPSVCEGFGIAAIESQATGLITFCSTNVPNIVDVSKYYKSLNIEVGAKVWANEIIKYKDGYKRENMMNNMIENRVDIKSIANYLENMYIRLLNGDGQ